MTTNHFYFPHCIKRHWDDVNTCKAMLNMKRLIHLPCIFIVIATTSCRKEKISGIDTDATILYLGNPAVDGCGWVIKIDGEEYRPENLKEHFMKDGLEVRVNYTVLKTRSSCGMNPNAMFNLKLNNIRKK